MPDKCRCECRVTLHLPVEPAVERCERPALRGFAFAQHQGAEGRREGQGVEGREADGDGHGQTELLVEDTGGAGHEGHGDEHQHHDQGDGDDGGADFVHRVDGCLARRGVARVELGVDRLDHHNGVVDHDGDGKHEGGEGDQVDGEADEVHHEERADKGHGYRDGRDKGGADILKEHVHHEEHKDECLNKRVDHGVDRRIEEVVVVHRYLYLTAFGYAGFEFVA